MQGERPITTNSIAADKQRRSPKKTKYPDTRTAHRGNKVESEKAHNLTSPFFIQINYEKIVGKGE